MITPLNHDAAGVNQMVARMKNVIDARKRALDAPADKYEFHVRRPSSEGKALNLVTERNFIDKSWQYCRFIRPQEYGISNAFNVSSIVFPQRFGKTTLLSFVDATMSLCHGFDIDRYQSFLQRLHTLESGDSFIHSMLHPVIKISLLGVSSRQDLVQQLTKAFQREGVNCYDIDLKSVTINTLMDIGLSRLQTVWNIAKSKLLADEQQWIDCAPILLIDEYDLPARNKVLSEKQCHDEAINELNYLSEWIKKETGSLFRTIIVSLLRLSGTGLSKMNSIDVSRTVDGHGVVGITETEAKAFFENLHDQAKVRIDAVETFWRWKKGSDSAAKEERVDAFYAYLRGWYNGFCFAVPDETMDVQAQVESLYNPFDLLYFLQRIGAIPCLDFKPWLRMYRRTFKQLVMKAAGDKRSVIEHLAGGEVSRDVLTEPIQPDNYFRGEKREVILRLYLELGFLSVSECICSDHAEVVVRLVPNSALDLKAKYDMISDEVDYDSTITAQKLESLCNVDAIKYELGRVLEKTAWTMQAVFRDFNHLREYDAQTQLLRTLQDDWNHNQIQIFPEYTTPKRYGHSSRIDVISRSFRRFWLEEGQVFSVLEAIIELKFCQEAIGSTRSSNLLDEGWNQALNAYSKLHQRHGESEAICEYHGRRVERGDVLLFSIVYHWHSNQMDIKVRCGRFDGDWASSISANEFEIHNGHLSNPDNILFSGHRRNPTRPLSPNESSEVRPS